MTCGEQGWVSVEAICANCGLSEAQVAQDGTGAEISLRDRGWVWTEGKWWCGQCAALLHKGEKGGAER